jgi:hypothetical protein
MIDPITAASTYASLVGLIGQFKSTKDAAQGKDFNGFMTWLIERGHDDIKVKIEANHTTTIGIKAVLSQQNDQLSEALSRIDAALAAFSSTLTGFAEISAGLKPESVISAQALGILQHLECSGASKMLEHSSLSGGTKLMLLDGKSSTFEVSDRRFLNDDLETLLRTGLLTLSHNDSGNRVFHYTRAASALVRRPGL